MTVGDLINVEGDIHIVTSTVNGEVKCSKSLQEYVTNTTVVKFDGEWLSLREVTERRMDSYIQAMGAEQLKENDNG